VDLFLSRADHFHYRGPKTNLVIRQYVRTFLPTNDTDKPFPTGTDIFRLSGYFPITCGPNPDARGPILFTLILS
jgi:hypothetical protein